MEHILRQNVVFVVLCTVLINVCESQFDLDNLDNLDLDNFDIGSLAKALTPECKYKCKNGAKPRQNPDHKASSNGCGSFGITLDFDDELPQMTACCDKHDICYDTCNTDRVKCDDDFHKCLQSSCDKNYSKHRKKKIEECKKAAMIMYSGATTLGCTAFLEAQQKACICDGNTKYSKQKARPKNEL